MSLLIREMQIKTSYLFTLTRTAKIETDSNKRWGRWEDGGRWEPYISLMGT